MASFASWKTAYPTMSDDEIMSRRGWAMMDESQTLASAERLTAARFARWHSEALAENERRAVLATPNAIIRRTASGWYSVSHPSSTRTPHFPNATAAVDFAEANYPGALIVQYATVDVQGEIRERVNCAGMTHREAESVVSQLIEPGPLAYRPTEMINGQEMCAGCSHVTDFCCCDDD